MNSPTSVRPGLMKTGTVAALVIALAASAVSAQTANERPVLPGQYQANPEGFPAAPPAPGATPLPGAPTTPPAAMPGGGGMPPTGSPPGASGAGAANPAADKPKFEIVWNNGLYIQATDKQFVSHVGATVQYDFSWYSATRDLQTQPGGTGPFNDGANLRRARIFMEGTLYSAVDYKFEIEFMNGFSPAGLTGPASAATVSNSPGPTDAWFALKDVPFFGNVRIGNQKEWFSLEHLNNYRALEFLERSYLFDFAQATAFNNGFSPGVSTFRTWADDRIFTAIGVYKNESDLIGFGIGDGQYAVTGRVAATPVWRPDEQIFWHVGGAMSHRDPVNDQVQIRIRDNIRNAPFPLLPLVANTGALNAASQDLFNLETAAVYKSLTLQAEYTANVVHGASVAATATTPAGPPQGTLFFQGYYAEAMWLVTGESRTFNTQAYALNRVTPRRALKLKPGDDGYGYGAWELAVRYSYVDLSNKGVRAGTLNSVTLGLNWYLNTSTKVQLNYDYTQRGNTAAAPRGHVNSVGIRAAYDF